MHLFDRLISAVTSAARDVLIDPGRAVWRSGNRVYIELRGARKPGTEAAARRLEQRLTEVAGEWAVRSPMRWLASRSA